MHINDKLVDACRNGNLTAVKECIELGADIHARNDLALQWATNYGCLDVVKYLIEQGANIHAKNDEALWWAAEKGHLEIVKYLVEQGANIHAKNDEALHRAKGRGHSEIVKYLKSVMEKEKVVKSHVMILDGKEIQLSEESYTKLRYDLLNYL